MMIKILIAIIFLSRFTSSFGSDRISLCEKEGEKYGNGLGVNVIPNDCYELFKKEANPEAVKTSESGKIFVVGHRNIIFIMQNEKVHILAGKYTELEEVIAVAIDEINKEIAVLDKRGDILIFQMNIPGNLAPLRIIRHKDLHGAVDLVINAKKNEVIVLNKSTESIIFFSRLANFNASEKKRQLSILKSIGNLVGHDSMTLDQEHQELFTLNTAKNSIQIFSLENSQAPVPTRVLPIAKGKNARKIEFSAVSNQIITTSLNGEIYKISRLP